MTEEEELEFLLSEKIDQSMLSEISEVLKMARKRREPFENLIIKEDND